MKTEFTIIIIFSLLLTCSVQSQWVQDTNGIGHLNSITSMVISGNNIFAGSNFCNNGVYLSTNKGLNWIQTSLNNQSVLSLASNGNNVFAGTAGDGVYLSTNIGSNWTQTSLYNQDVWSLSINGNNIFAATANNGVYLSTNNGLSWTQTSLNNQTVYSISISGNNIFAGTASNGVYFSTNNGTSWTQTALNNQNVGALAINSNYIFAGTSVNGVYISSNNGLSWTQTSLNNQWVLLLAISGNNVFAGPYLNGIYLSTNNGTNWLQQNEGFPNLISIESICIINNYVLVGTQPYGIWRRNLLELIGIEKISCNLPTKFMLYQNYPNPFNPTTKIKFNIPASPVPSKGGGQEVSIKIYDVLGKEVASLIPPLWGGQEGLSPGTYEVTWDATNYPSGIYFIKLIMNSYNQTRKMVLLK